MRAESINPRMGAMEGIHPERLFQGSCFALISTAVTFAMLGAIVSVLKLQFNLTNERVGLIAAAGLFGFPISIFIFGPLCDFLGMKFLLRLAFTCHSIGVVMMIAAGSVVGYWFLFFGALIIAMGNGLVEAACNPLVATIYPDRKTEKLNKFHVWFPGGIVIGGLVSFGMDKMEMGASWQLKLGVILVPTMIYGILFTAQKFPATERVQSGVSAGEMFKSTFTRPLFLLLLSCMIMTASLELGPNRWIPSVLKSAAVPGILVLVWISAIMAVMRYYVGAVVHRLSPTGILFCSAIIGGAGLTWLSFADTAATGLVSAAIFALGVCYFWPTMLGVVSERVPRGGALALAVIGGVGTTFGGISGWAMGKDSDQYVHVELMKSSDATIACLEQVESGFPKLRLLYEKEGKPTVDIDKAIKEAEEVLAYSRKGESLPKLKTALSLQAAINAAPGDDVIRERVENILKTTESSTERGIAEKLLSIAKGGSNNGVNGKEQTRLAIRNGAKELVAASSEPAGAKAVLVLAESVAARQHAEEVIGPADTLGGRVSFRHVAVLGGILAVIFGLLYVSDRRKGGYKVEKIAGHEPNEAGRV